MEKHLHIICLNVPYPVDYGGVFDLYYKLPALQQQGVKIHLHCFDYGRGEQPALNRFCESVYYYARNNSLSSLSLRYPYIVKSRSSRQLLQRLLQDNYPILMEGVHCTYLLNDKRFDNRRRFVRLHNVEYIYYRHLFDYTSAPFKKLYFLAESLLLKNYEKSIAPKAAFLSVTEKDAEVYKNLGSENVSFLPLFLPAWKVKMTEGKGSFCLYHGDLSVAENEKAATWLVQQVFNDLKIPFVVAGKNPSGKLTRLIHQNGTACLVANPDEKEMQDLIEKAHINIIPSFNATGIKLKLINALFNGRHCIVNKPTVDGSGLEKSCHLAADADSFKSVITRLYSQPFTSCDVDLRHGLLDPMFDNEKNAKQLMQLIWNNKASDSGE